MIPATAADRIQVLRIPLITIVDDFLNRHIPRDDQYELPDHARILRQDHLPNDAHVRWARIEIDDARVRETIIAAREWISALYAVGHVRDLYDHLIAQRSTMNVEHPDTLLMTTYALMEAVHYDSLIGLLGHLTSLLEDDPRAALAEAIAEPTPRYLLVAIASDEFLTVAHDDAPTLPFNVAAFRPPDPSKGET